MTKFYFPDVPDYNFYFQVPASITAYEKIKLKFTKVSWAFEQWTKDSVMDYTVYYEAPEPTAASTTTAENTPTCSLNAVLD